MSNINRDDVAEILEAQFGMLEGDTQDYEFTETYSGRGMFGKLSNVALIARFHPRNSEAGRTLVELGMCYDNMGLDWVYYTK